MATWLAIVAALAVGYALGRARPYDRLADWTNWQLRFGIDRWVSRPRQVALFTLLLLTDTRRTATRGGTVRTRSQSGRPH